MKHFTSKCVPRLLSCSGTASGAAPTAALAASSRWASSSSSPTDAPSDPRERQPALSGSARKVKSPRRRTLKSPGDGAKRASGGAKAAGPSPSRKSSRNSARRAAVHLERDLSSLLDAATSGPAPLLACLTAPASGGASCAVSAPPAASAPRAAPRASAHATGSPAAAAAKNPATLSDAELAQAVSVGLTVERVRDALACCVSYAREWARLPSARSMRRWERQLVAAVTAASPQQFAALLSLLQARMSEPLSTSGQQEAFLLLYTRTLANYGMLCLERLDVEQAATLLEEAIAGAQRLEEALRRRERDEVPSHADTLEAHSADTESAAVPPDLRAETSVLYLRVLLAKAYACGGHQWRAAQQYMEVLRVAAAHPLRELPQIAPGLPLRLRPFVQAVAEDEFAQLLTDAAAVEAACAQGAAARLLHEARGDGEDLRRTELGLARVHRYAGRWARSVEHYTAYLDALADAGEQDTERVMLELGRMLAYDARHVDPDNVAAGLVYLEVATGFLTEDAEAAAAGAEEAETEGVCRPEHRANAREAALLAAAALADMAIIYREQGEAVAAVRLMERAVGVLGRGGCAAHGAWLLQQCGDMLGSLQRIDSAMECYDRAAAILRPSDESNVEAADADAGGVPSTPPQLCEQQRFRHMQAAVIDLRKAYLLQEHVRDYQGAIRIYQGVFSQNYQMRVSVRRRRRTSTRVRVRKSLMMRLHPRDAQWGLANFVACCEAAGETAAAIDAQQQVIMLETALRLDPTDANLKLAQLLERNQDMAGALMTYYDVFARNAQQNTKLGPVRLLEVAQSMARCCYAVDNSTMQAVLLRLVQQVTEDDVPAVNAEYATAVSSATEEGQALLATALDAQTNVETLARILKRAAQVVTADLTLLELTGGGGRPLHGDSDDETRLGAVLREGRRTVAGELSAAIVLSRGAFFFHQHQMTAQAAELYGMAMELWEKASPAARRNNEYLACIATVLTNYATFISDTDAARAERLYEEAAAMPGDVVEVQQAAAYFFLNIHNTTKAVQYMERAAELNSTDSVLLGKLAVLQFHQWDTLEAPKRYRLFEVLLQTFGPLPDDLPGHADNDDAQMQAWLEQMVPYFRNAVSLPECPGQAVVALYVLAACLEDEESVHDLFQTALRAHPLATQLHLNYAKYCQDHGRLRLWRRHMALGLAAGSREAVAARSFATMVLSESEEKLQGDAAEGVARFAVSASGPENRPAALNCYAVVLSSALPMPFLTEKSFAAAYAAAPTDATLLGAYSNFVWAAAGSRTAMLQPGRMEALVERAERLHREAVAANPTDAGAWLRLGNFCSTQLERFDEAYAALTEARRLAPNDTTVLRRLTDLLVEEATRVQQEDSRLFAAAGSLREQSPRQRELVEAAARGVRHLADHNLADAETLTRYATFAAQVMRDPAFAASLFRTVNHMR